jgi:hypothetical protein
MLVDPAMGPQEERIVPVLGTTVRKGEVIDVPDDVAGQGPCDGDLGSGLLAQVDIWSEQEGGE